MRKFLRLFSFIILLNSATYGQAFISIDPDSALQGVTITTTVTSSGFFFTVGSAPTPWGNFYMTNFSTYIFPNWVTVIDDDHFVANWTIPANQVPGNYIVRYEYFDPWNPWGWPSTADIPGGFTITSCPGPVATITAQSATTFCTGGSVVLNANTGPGLTWQWYRSNNIINGATSSSYAATLTGSYQALVSNGTGCYTFSNTISVSALSLPNAGITYTAPAAFCPGGSELLTGFNQVGYQYQWRNNGVNIPGATNSTYSATVAGSYTVRTTATNGCTNTTTNPVSVSALTAPSAVITPSGPLTYCAGTGVTLNANSGTGYAYQWYKFGNLIPGATNQSLSVTGSAKYKVRVTNPFTCTKMSAAVTTTSIPLPTATITAQGPITFCAGDSVKLAANTGAGLSYMWKKYNNIIAGATGSNYTVKTAGKYKAIVTNSSGCSKGSNSITVSVPCRMAGAELPEGEVFIYDDPSQKKLFVEGDWDGPVELINVQGQVVKSVSGYLPNGIDLSDLPGGIYLAVVSTSKEVFTHKFYHTR